MATGFEALGAVSAVFRVISFSAKVIALCKKIYDGKPTANDDLEGHATRMSEAIIRIEDRCKALQTGQQSTEAEVKLNEIAKSCRLSAQELQTEVRFVTDQQRKGNVISALRSALRASSHRKRIERLELALSRCRRVMETELLALIWSVIARDMPMVSCLRRHLALKAMRRSSIKKLHSTTWPVISRVLYYRSLKGTSSWRI